MSKFARMWLGLGLASMGAFAQTNTFPATGNVGIGTTTPLYPLDVHGAIAIQGVPVLDDSSFSAQGDGAYVIASGYRLHGEYIITFDNACFSHDG